MNFSRFKEIVVNSVIAITKGEFLMRVGIDRYFLHILWAFFLFTIAIWTNIKIESTMLQMQRNKTTIENLKIFHGKTTCDLEKLKRINTIEDLLIKKESDVKIPEKPATRIKD